jgi:hypothetical protein
MLLAYYDIHSRKGYKSRSCLEQREEVISKAYLHKNIYTT